MNMIKCSVPTCLREVLQRQVAVAVAVVSSCRIVIYIVGS